MSLLIIKYTLYSIFFFTLISFIIKHDKEIIVTKNIITIFHILYLTGVPVT